MISGRQYEMEEKPRKRFFFASKYLPVPSFPP